MSAQKQVPAIYAALAAARASIDGYIRKDTSAGQGRGVSHDAVTAHCRAALIDAGVLVLPSLVDATTSEYKTERGKRMVQMDVRVDVRFVAVADGSEVTVCMPACGQDQGDKAPGKALSYATKFALLKVLSIETGEDDESRAPGPVETVTPEEAERLRVAVEEVGSVDAFLGAFRVERFEDLEATAAPRAWASVEKKRELLKQQQDHGGAT